MKPDLLQAVIWTTVSLMLLIVVFRVVFIPTFVEVLRQDLFKIRRDLFLYMAEGNIDPCHPAYTSLRTTINACLRYAEKMSYVNILFGFLTKKATKQYEEGVVQALKMIENPEVQKKLHAFRVEVYKAIGIHMFRVSPLLWVATALSLVLFTLLLIVALVTKSVQTLCVRAWDRIREALDIVVTDALGQLPESDPLTTENGRLATDTKVFTL
jgi:hypothetical protein